jgi:hypothetical protein
MFFSTAQADKKKLSAPSQGIKAELFYFSMF